MEGTLHIVDGRNVVRFERRLAHRVEKVWRAVTEPTHLAQWFPADMDPDLAAGVGGTVRFSFRNGEAPPSEGRIVELDPPRVFAFTWHGDMLRIELRPDGDGCVLVFTHTFDDRPAAASYASGWQTCLDGLASALAGAPAAPPPDWYPGLHERYAVAFDLTEGSVRETDGGFALRVERQLVRPAEDVWNMLAGSGTPAPGGPVPAGFTIPLVEPGAVTVAEPPVVLEYGWADPSGAAGGSGRVRWQLSSGPGGARLVVTQHGPAAPGLPHQVLSAWRERVQRFASGLAEPSSGARTAGADAAGPDAAGADAAGADAAR